MHGDFLVRVSRAFRGRNCQQESGVRVYNPMECTPTACMGGCPQCPMHGSAPRAYRYRRLTHTYGPCIRSMCPCVHPRSCRRCVCTYAHELSPLTGTGTTAGRRPTPMPQTPGMMQPSHLPASIPWATCMSTPNLNPPTMHGERPPAPHHCLVSPGVAPRWSEMFARPPPIPK